MITLFSCLGSGNCYKPWLAMTQLGISFELELIDVLKGEQKTPDYLRINPLGVVPYLMLKNGQGIGESNAMLWYLAEDTHLMPSTVEARAEALQWMFFEQSKLEPFISPARFFTTILPGERENRQADIVQWQTAASTGLARLDAHLSGRDFMLSEGFTITDIAIYGYVHVLEEAGLKMADYPAIYRWTEAVCQVEGYRPLTELGSGLTQAA